MANLMVLSAIWDLAVVFSFLVAMFSNHWLVPEYQLAEYYPGETVNKTVELAGMWQICIPQVLETDEEGQTQVKSITGTGECAFVFNGKSCGCTTDTSKFYGDIYGHDQTSTLDAARAFAIIFGGIAAAKVASKIFAACCGQGFQLFYFAILDFAQAAAGSIGGGLFFGIIRKTHSDQPSDVERSLSKNIGWGWLIFACFALVAMIWSIISFVQCMFYVGCKKKEGRGRGQERSKSRFSYYSRSPDDEERNRGGFTVD